MKTKSLLFTVVLGLSIFSFGAYAEDSKDMPESGSRMVRHRNQPVESVAPQVADRFDDVLSQSLSHIPDDVNCAGLLGDDDDRSGYDAI